FRHGLAKIIATPGWRRRRWRLGNVFYKPTDHFRDWILIIGDTQIAPITIYGHRNNRVVKASLVQVQVLNRCRKGMPVVLLIAQTPAAGHVEALCHQPTDQIITNLLTSLDARTLVFLVRRIFYWNVIDGKDREGWNTVFFENLILVVTKNENKIRLEFIDAFTRLAVGRLQYSLVLCSEGHPFIAVPLLLHLFRPVLWVLHMNRRKFALQIATQVNIRQTRQRPGNSRPVTTTNTKNLSHNILRFGLNDELPSGSENPLGLSEAFRRVVPEHFSHDLIAQRFPRQYHVGGPRKAG